MKLVLALLLLTTSVSAEAREWYVGGYLVSNVCSNAFGFWAYPFNWALPVGSDCRLPNGAAGIVGG